jgi:hypothetical protein
VIVPGDWQAQLHKRFTLNLLIQGAAAHTYIAAHHLVARELRQLHPGLVQLYDRLAVHLHLSQWQTEPFLVLGSPKKFWRTLSRPTHPFHGHAFLMRHGPGLSRASWRRTVRRGRRFHCSELAGIQLAETLRLLRQALTIEQKHARQLEELCVQATSQIWNIDPERLTGKLTPDVEFGNLQEPQSPAGQILRASAAGYGGVRRADGRFQVVARALTWPLLAHELTKGTAELVCLHGLNRLDDDTYQRVTAEADRIEHEIWMIQAGGELWRKFLDALPPRETGGPMTLAESLMRVAMLDPQPLEQLMMDLVEHPLTARATLADLFDSLPAID